MEVRLISHSDLGPLVCGYAAKVCTSAEMPECPDELTVTMRKGEVSPFKKALDHALASGHDSVLEHWSATFAIEEVSRVLEIQLVRHRLASYSIQSGRYCMRDPTNYVLPKSIADAVENELMNGGGWSPNGCLQDALRYYEQSLKDVTERMRKLGVPEEDIRYLYPQGLKTNIVVTMNARELRHFLGLRLCTRAQKEIRELAERMLECLKDECPELFKDIGPQCEQLGYCPEEKGCGRYPDLFALGEEYWIGHGEWRSS